MTPEYFCKFNKQIHAAIKGKNENLENGYKFVMKVTKDCEDWSEYQKDDFVARMTDNFLSDLTAWLRDNDTKQLKRKESEASSHTYKWGRGFEGANYANTRSLSFKEVVQLIREEIKIRYPEPEYKFSIRTEYFANGQAIHVEVKELPFNPYSAEYTKMFKAGTDARKIQDEMRDNHYELYSPEYQKLEQSLKRIVSQYNYDDSDPMTDYFSVRFYDHIRLDTEKFKERLNPNHPEVKRHKEWNKEWEEKAAKRNKRAAEIRKDAYPKWSLVKYTAQFKGKDPLEVIAVVTKSISGRASFGGTYNIAFLGPVVSRTAEGTQRIARGKIYNWERISPKALSPLDKPIWQYTWPEYRQMFIDAYFVSNPDSPYYGGSVYEKNKTTVEERFEKYYGKKVQAMHKKVVRDAVKDGEDVPADVLKSHKLKGKKKAAPKADPVAEAKEVLTTVPGLQLVKYSAKSVALFGDTKPIKDQLKAMGGRFNPNLKHPDTGKRTPGWIFPIAKQDKLQELIGDKDTGGKAEQGEHTEVIERINEKLNPYGWEAKPQEGGQIGLYNANGKYVGYIKFRKGGYNIYNRGDAKLLSGNNHPADGALKVATKMYYAKLRTTKPEPKEPSQFATQVRIFMEEQSGQQFTIDEDTENRVVLRGKTKIQPTTKDVIRRAFDAMGQDRPSGIQDSRLSLTKAQWADVMHHYEKPDAKPEPKKADKPKAKSKAKDKPKPKKYPSQKKARAAFAQEAKAIWDKKKMTEAEVIKTGKAFQEKRGQYGIIDAKQTNRKVLAPTHNNLKRWLTNPGRYDLIGVDTLKDADPTVVARAVKRARFFNSFGL